MEQKLSVKLDEATRLAVEDWLSKPPGVRSDELLLKQEFTVDGLPCQALIALVEDTGEIWSPGFDAAVESRALPPGGVMSCGDGPFRLGSNESPPLAAIEAALSALLDELLATRPDWVEAARDLPQPWPADRRGAEAAGGPGAQATPYS